MKKLYPLFLLSIVLFFPPNTLKAQTPLDTLSLKSIFHEPYIPGNRPSLVSFSIDGKYLYYNWQEHSDSSNAMYEVDLKGKKTSKAPEDIVRSYTLSPNGKKVIYQKRGDIAIADADFKNERVIIASKGFDYNATWNSDGSEVAFIANGDVWIAGVKEPSIKQITSKKEDDPGYRIAEWSSTGKLLVAQSDNSDSKEYYFPEYVDTYVKTGSTRRGIGSFILSVIDIKTGKVTKLLDGKGFPRSDLSPSGKYAALDLIDAPMKHRTISIHDFENDSTYTIFEDSTKGWLYGTSMEFAPKSDLLMIQSEKDGWNHIYTIKPDGTGMKQHTKGDYDIPFAEWLDSKSMVIATSENDPGDIQLYKLTLSSNKKEQLTKSEGHRRDFRLSPDKRYVAYNKTFFNEPADIYLVDIKNPGKEIKLTDTVPEEFYEMGWQKEDYVRFTGRDGNTQLSASILKPDEIDETNGNPVVVFVHGAGSLQNVFKGFSFSYWREYMFNQYLTKKGYYVIEVDYRHSTGYGRKFREDVTGWMGKYETEDIEDGLAYLAENYAGADTSRVGVYGGSYGGFMALYTVSVSPEHFDAAAALRSVTNWENYYYTNPWYTYPRLGTPQADSANYARSSPITYADSLTKPVLILHGLIDNNVGFQDAAQYIERLIQSGNTNFDMMMYPSERHSFRDPDSWYDEYYRIFEFFQEELDNN
jgi:dipeptidyl aminopeptidase/acylaminoacyl peptidase